VLGDEGGEVGRDVGGHAQSSREGYAYEGAACGPCDLFCCVGNDIRVGFGVLEADARLARRAGC